MNDVTVDDIFTIHIPQRLADRPALAKQINAKFQFHLGGGKSPHWALDLTKSTTQCSETEMTDPDVTITMSSTDFLDLVSGRLNGQVAFMQGKLKVKGELALLLKLQQLFD